MNIQVDLQVFKLNDDRVSLLAKGRLTTRVFATLLHKNDYMIMLGNKVYALSESQYYSTLDKSQFKLKLDKNMFQSVLNLQYPFQAQDKSLIKTIKQTLKDCTRCQYNKYKNLVATMLARYPQVCKKIGYTPMEPKKLAPYPTCSGVVSNKVSSLVPHFFNVNQTERPACFDCVVKHTGVAAVQLDIVKAGIKQAQIAYGYKQHYLLGLANLQQAFQECPKEAQSLKSTLLFCIGKSKYDNQLFVPVQALLKLVFLQKARFSQEHQAKVENKPDQTMQLELTQAQLQLILELPTATRVNLLSYIKLANSYSCMQTVDVQDQLKAKWQGAVSSAADCIVTILPDVSNVLRNRRLLFKECPSLIQATEFNLQQLQDQLKKSFEKK